MRRQHRKAQPFHFLIELESCRHVQTIGLVALQYELQAEHFWAFLISEPTHSSNQKMAVGQVIQQV